jgi:hypothetical protein
MKKSLRRMALAQIREHVRTVVVIPHAGLVERIELGRGKGRCGDRQGDRLIQPLKTGQAYPPIFGLIRMLITVAPSAFYAFSKRRIVAAMRHEVTNNHFTLFSHESSLGAAAFSSAQHRI